MKIKIISLSVFFLIIGLYAWSQKPVEINQTDIDGKKFGKWEARYPEGTIRYTGEFYNDKPIGEFLYYFPSGKLRASNSWSNNGSKAFNKTYSEDGILLAEGIYVDQKKDSIWRIYTEIEGLLLSEETYKNNILNGLTKVYYPETGQLSETLEYVDGNKEGPWITYYENAKIHSEGSFINNQIDGPISYFHLNSQIQVKGQYKSGERVGVWQTYDEDGQLIAEDIHKSLDD